MRPPLTAPVDYTQNTMPTVIVEGKPQAQSRHRTGRYGTYDPSAAAKRTFKDAVQAALNNPEELPLVQFSL